MSLTTQQRMDRVKVYAEQYIAFDRLPDAFLIKIIERGRDHVWRSLAPTSRDFLFRTTATVADGSAWPVDFVTYANNAYYTVSGNKIPFRYITVQKIGSAFKNKYGVGSATNPGISFYDRAVHTAPAGLSGITIQYIKKPTALDGQPLSTTDEMPEDSEYLIVRASFERALPLIVNDPEMLKLIGMEKEYVQAQIQRYYTDTYQRNVIAGGEIAIAAEETTV